MTCGKCYVTYDPGHVTHETGRMGGGEHYLKMWSEGVLKIFFLHRMTPWNDE